MSRVVLKVGGRVAAQAAGDAVKLAADGTEVVVVHGAGPQISAEMERRGLATLLEELRFFKLRHKADQTHQLWQESSHPQQIQNDEMMLQKLEYMHHNPLRRGYVDDPTHWRYSSARNYAGMKGLIEVITDWR